MRGLLWVVTLFALAVGASLAAHFNEGYVLLVLPPYRVELSLNLLVIIGGGAFLLFYLVLRTVALTRNLPQRVREYRQRRQNERMVEVFSDATRLLFEGRFSQSMKKAEEAHAAGHSPALAALLAARSAQRLRELDKLLEWLERAVAADAKMQAASLMLEAEMHIELRQYEDARGVLKRLHELSGRHMAALRLELRAEQGAGNWDEVLRIARLLEKHHAVSPESTHGLKRKAHFELIHQLRTDRERLTEYRKSIPDDELDADLMAELSRAEKNG